MALYIEEKLVVTYGVKYTDYHRNIRSRQVDRAEALINKCAKAAKRPQQNDVRRFIDEINVTPSGEIA